MHYQVTEELGNRHASFLLMVGTNSSGERAVPEWKAAHEALSRLARQRAAADAEEGRWLLRASRASTHEHFGMSSFVEYCERMFGYRPRTTMERLRVAEALESLPALTQALEQGSISWSAVRELTRVAVDATEAEWLALAADKTLRQLEELVAGKRPGDRPSAAPDLKAIRHVLRFEVSAETFALFREALAELRRRSDAAIGDDAALLEMARHVLGESRDLGRSSYQVVLSVCPACSAGRQAGNGQLVRVGPEVVEMARCDAQHVPDESVAGHAHVHKRAKQDIPPALRRAVLLRDEQRCRVPGCKNAVFLDLHHIQLRSEGGRHEASNLITVCSAHHRALHRGELHIADHAHGSLFRHADGRAYGQLQTPGLTVQAKVSAGLRGLGFRDTEVRAVMAALQQQDDLAEATPQKWLRAALQRLHPPRQH